MMVSCNSILNLFLYKLNLNLLNHLCIYSQLFFLYIVANVYTEKYRDNTKIYIMDKSFYSYCFYNSVRPQFLTIIVNLRRPILTIMRYIKKY